MSIILFLCFIGLLYALYKITKNIDKEIHDNYIKIQDQIKQLNDEYVNGKYDFETYKEKKNALFESYHIPLNYKEDL